MATPAQRELTALRLNAQRIAHSEFTSPAEVVRWMLAMQAQDFPGAKWSVGLRLPGSTDAAIEAALAHGQIVRSWPMRGTLHLVAPEDLGWMLAISATRQRNFSRKRRDDLGITDRELARAGQLAYDALSGGRVMRRDDLLAVFEADGIPTTAQRGYHLLWNLSHDGLLVFGPSDGKHPTFTLLAEWVPAPRVLEGDEALGEFARRYFASHAPATERDFAWWASITLGDARTGIAIADLETRDFDGVTYYLPAGLEPAPRAVHALPGFDEYMLGYSDRSAGLPAEHANRIVPGNNGVFLPTILDNGQVVGTWRRSETSKEIRVETVPFTTLNARTITGFEKAISRYGRFRGKPATIR